MLDFEYRGSIVDAVNFATVTNLYRNSCHFAVIFYCPYTYIFKLFPPSGGDVILFLSATAVTKFQQQLSQCRR